MGERFGGEAVGGGRLGGGFGGERLRIGECIDAVFEADPGDEGGAEGEVEETFVGDGEDDEGGRESEENDDEAVEVVIVGADFVNEGKAEGGCQSQPSDDLTAWGKTLFGLKRRDARTCDDDCKEDESDLNAHNRTRNEVR